MLNGTSSLGYTLYRDAARTQLFENDSNDILQIPAGPNTLTLAPGQSNPNFDTGIRLYGRVNGGQTPPAMGVHSSVFSGGDIKVRARSGSESQNYCLPVGTNLPGTTSFTIQANVTSWCKISSGALLDFGERLVTATGNTTATGALEVACSIGTNYSIGLDNGQHGGAGTTRRMQHVTASTLIGYQLYKNGYGQGVWGNTGSLRKTGQVGTGSAEPHTVYGRVQASQVPANPPLGEYTDLVTITVEY